MTNPKRAATPRQKAQLSSSVKQVEPRNEAQEKYLETIDENIVTFGVGPAGTGKAQPMHAKIKTPSGWITMSEIKVGDEICTPEGKTTRVLKIFPQGKKDYYRITFIDGSTAESCGDHLWKVWNQDWSCGYKVISLYDLIDYTKLPSKNKRLYIPLTKPVYGLHREHFISPYLLGALIGDGCLTIPTPRLTAADKEILEIIESELPAGYVLNKIPSGVYEYSIKRQNKRNAANDLDVELKKLGLFGKRSHEKFIPEDYLEGTAEQRMDLLQGLMDTDGTAEIKRGISYSTSSRQLSEDVQALVRSLGGLAKEGTKTPQYTYKGKRKQGKDAYIVTIRIKNPKSLFRLSRKANRLQGEGQYEEGLKKRINSIEFVGEAECQCILVDHPEHLYITDSYSVTHNTYLAMYQAVTYLSAKKDIKRIILTRPIVEAGERLGFLPGLLEDKMDPFMRPLYDSLYEMVGQQDAKAKISNGTIEIAPIAFMRGRTFKDAFIIVDEAQNCTYEQLKMVLTRLGENTKLVISGDMSQSDLNGKSGLGRIVDAVAGTNNVGVIKFGSQDVVRSEIVRDLLASMDRYEEESSR